MSFADVDERPAKKRRFFLDEDSSIADHTLDPEPSLPDEINALPETLPDATAAKETAETPSIEQDAVGGFDTSLFASVVGEQVSESTIKRLQELSGGDIQRGENLVKAFMAWYTDLCSCQCIPRRVMEKRIATSTVIET